MSKRVITSDWVSIILAGMALLLTSTFAIGADHATFTLTNRLSVPATYHVRWGHHGWRMYTLPAGHVVSHSIEMDGCGRHAET